MSAGLWPLSFQQRLDVNGLPYIGAKATFLEAATLDPLPVWQNYDLTVAHANPVVSDGFGVFPAIFIDAAEGFYRFRVTDSGGVVLTDLVQLPVIGPSAAVPAVSPTDPNALLQTGDTKWRLGTGAHTGWVRVNGRTMGNAASGGTERAAADTEALFTHIYGNFSDTLCPVSGGRGASAAADFAANKTITLPDVRGRTIAGMDDMGGAASGRLTSTTITVGGPTTLGGAGGVQTHTLALTEAPAHDHTGALTTNTEAAHGHPWRRSTATGGGPDGTGGLANFLTGATNQAAFTGTPSNTAGEQIGGGGAHSHTVTVPSAGGGAAHTNLQPSFLATLYAKL